MELGNIYKLGSEYVMSIGWGYLKRELGKVIIIDSKFKRKTIDIEDINCLKYVKSLEKRTIVNRKGIEYSYIKVKNGNIYGKSGTPVDKNEKNAVNARIAALFE